MSYNKKTNSVLVWAYITVFMIGESAIHFRSEEAANVFNM